MHLLRLLPGSLPGRRHRRGPEFRILDRNAGRTLLRQGQTPRQRRSLGGRNRPQPRSRRTVSVRPRKQGASMGRIETGLIGAVGGALVVALALLSGSFLHGPTGADGAVGPAGEIGPAGPAGET